MTTNMTTTKQLIETFIKLRSQPYSYKRTSLCTETAIQMMSCLNKMKNVNVKLKLNYVSNNEGEQLYHVQSLIVILNDFIADPRGNKIDGGLTRTKIMTIIELLDIYFIRNYSDFVGNLVRNALMNVFTVPSNISFNSNDILMLHSYLKTNTKKQIKESEYGRHILFYERIAKFFLAHSKIIWETISVDNHLINEETCNNMFQHSLVGMSQGDAIGFLVEGQNSTEHFVNTVFSGNKFRNYGVDNHFGHTGKLRYTTDKTQMAFKFGQYTDDTILARELIKSLKESNGNFDSKDYANRLITLFKKAKLLRDNRSGATRIANLQIFSGIVGYGSSTRQSVQLLSDGVAPELIGSFVETQGNGSVMRVGPLGALFVEQPFKLWSIASKQSLLTHGNSRCVACCVLIAECSRLSCESVIYPWSKHLPYTPTLLCERLANAVRIFDKEIADAVMCIPTFLKETNIKKLVKMITTKGQELGDSLWGGGSVISASCVQTSLFAIVCFLKSPDNIIQGIETCILAAGDSDTTSAIVASIIANRTKSIPGISTFDRYKWTSDDLKKLAIETRNTIVSSHFISRT